jgi:hypothetical protein
MRRYLATNWQWWLLFALAATAAIKLTYLFPAAFRPS